MIERFQVVSHFGNGGDTFRMASCIARELAKSNGICGRTITLVKVPAHA